MTPILQTPELRAVAERVVWFKEPDEVLADAAYFLAHVMTYGTPEDVAAIRGDPARGFGNGARSGAARYV